MNKPEAKVWIFDQEYLSLLIEQVKREERAQKVTPGFEHRQEI